MSTLKTKYWLDSTERETDLLGSNLESRKKFLGGCPLLEMSADGRCNSFPGGQAPRS